MPRYDEKTMERLVNEVLGEQGRNDFELVLLRQGADIVGTVEEGSIGVSKWAIRVRQKVEGAKNFIGVPTANMEIQTPPEASEEKIKAAIAAELIRQLGKEG